MKISGILLVAASIVFLGINDSLKYIKYTKTLNEILRLIILFKNEIIYKKASFSELYLSGEKECFNNIVFKNGEITLIETTPKNINREFIAFINKIGTTDDVGQGVICDSFYNTFTAVLSEQKQKEKSKLQVNLSLSLLGALSVVIIFI